MSHKLREALGRIRPVVEVSRCIVDEDGGITLRVLNPRYEDDRNNVIDLEGVGYQESLAILDMKSHRLGLHSENGKLALAVAIMIHQELK